MKRILAVMAALVLSLTGCDAHRAPSLDDPPPTVGDAAQLARMRQQAHDILDRWEAAYAAAKQPVFIPLNPFEPGVVGLSGSENAKDIEDHRFLLEGPDYDLLVGIQLRWPSGQTRTITPLTAMQAYGAMTARLRDECGGCSPTRTVRITGAHPTRAPIDAIDGPVTVPAWEFTLDGYQARLVMPAVAATEALVPPEAPWDSAHPPLGLSFMTARSTSDGRTVTIDFIGAQFGADKPCGKDYTLEAFTSVHAVVIIVRTVDYKGVGLGACNMMGFPRTASIQLAEPLGNRVLLEGTVGHPVILNKA